MLITASVSLKHPPGFPTRKSRGCVADCLQLRANVAVSEFCWSGTERN